MPITDPGPMPIRADGEHAETYSRRKAVWQGQMLDWRRHQADQETPEDTARILEQQRQALWERKPEPVASAMPVPPPASEQRMPTPVPTGNPCRRCGGQMQRTGACETCSSCGENTGCG